MKYEIARDARPQVKTLLFAALLTIALWFVPFAEMLTYPVRLFVTFIHEGGHILAALLTGNRVASLTVYADTSGAVFSTQSNFISALLISSAGYLGAITFGALLLIAIRRTVAARFVLAASAAFIALITLIYGLFGSLFTVASGLTIAVLLIVTARFASAKIANFLVAFLAVQCVLNALTDLKTVFFMSSPFAPQVHTDAANMAAATGIPAIIWATFWVVVSIGILLVALRVYAMKRNEPLQHELPFEDPVDLSADDVPFDSTNDSRPM